MRLLFGSLFTFKTKMLIKLFKNIFALAKSIFNIV